MFVPSVLDVRQILAYYNMLHAREQAILREKWQFVENLAQLAGVLAYLMQ
jgi:hypothetical protein